jgi:ADP-ribosylglycohydrolase
MEASPTDIRQPLYVFTRHCDDFHGGILEAANSPGDSDSIACMVGALIGAHLGVDAIPSEWVANVEKSVELGVLAHRVGKAIEARPQG